MNLRQRACLLQRSVSCTGINIWVAYFWKSEKQNKIRFRESVCYRKQAVFIYWFITECSGTLLDKRFTSSVTACTGLVTAVEVSQGFIYSCRFTWCIFISPVRWNSLRLCASEAPGSVISSTSPPALTEHQVRLRQHTRRKVVSAGRVREEEGRAHSLYINICYVGHDTAKRASRWLDAILSGNG